MACSGTPIRYRNAAAGRFGDATRYRV